MILHYAKRMREMYDLAKYLPPISIKGESAMAVTEYSIVYGTRVLYDYTRFVLGLDSISLNVRRT